MSGWYKQQRSLSGRFWFKDANLVQLYAALKSLAYVTDGRYKDTIVRRGSCPTTRADLMEITGMKRMTLDRCLKKLIAYGEIIVRASNKYSIVTVCDYDSSESSESLFSATDGITDGIAGGISNGIAGGNTHLSTIEGRIKNKEDLITPYSPYKKERESEEEALEIKKRYNKTFDGKLPPCVRLTLPTRLMVEECVRRFGRQSVDVVFEQVLQEPFSLGQNKTGFIARFQFIFEPKNFQAYLERAQLRRSRQQAEQPQQEPSSVTEQPKTGGSWLDAYNENKNWKPQIKK